DLERRAAATALPGSVSRLGYLANLSSMLGQLGEHTADHAVLAEAVDVGREAVAGPSADLPTSATGLYILGNALVALGAATGDQAALAEANQCLAQVAVNATAATHL